MLLKSGLYGGDELPSSWLCGARFVALSHTQRVWGSLGWTVPKSYSIYRSLENFLVLAVSLFWSMLRPAAQSSHTVLIPPPVFCVCLLTLGNYLTSPGFIQNNRSQAVLNWDFSASVSGLTKGLMA